MDLSLDKVLLNEEVFVSYIKDGDIKRRFLDIGLSNNTLVKPIFNSICGYIRAYKIRNCLIGIRDCDASLVIVRRCNE